MTESKAADIRAMPTEILLQIFSYLPCKTNAYVVPKVCKRWQKIYTDPSLYRNLKFTGKRPGTKKAVFILTNLARDLNSLTLSNRTDANELLKAVGQKNVMIKSLTVVNCSGNEDDLFISPANMLRLVTKCTALRTLRFKTTHTSCGPAFFRRLIGLKHLESLQPGSVRSTFRHSQLDILRTIATRTPEHPLQDVRLFHDRNDRFSRVVSNQALAELVRTQGPSLRTLKANARKLNNDSMALVAACTHLRSLSLQYLHKVNGRGLLSLGRLELSRLSLGFSRASSRAWVSLFQAPTLRCLLKLKLTRCKHVDDSVLKTIAANLTRLRVLRISRCGVSTQARERIRDVLPACRITFIPRHVQAR